MAESRLYKTAHYNCRDHNTPLLTFVNDMALHAVYANKAEASSFRCRLFCEGLLTHNRITPSGIAGQEPGGTFRAIQSCGFAAIALAATGTSHGESRPLLWRTVVDDYSALALKRGPRPCVREIHLKGQIDAEDIDSIEVELGVETALNVASLPEAMLLAREEEIANRIAFAPQRLNHSFCLIRWHDGVLVTLEEDHRLSRADARDRRASARDIALPPADRVRSASRDSEMGYRGWSLRLACR
jgi:hypothetical protein